MIREVVFLVQKTAKKRKKKLSDHKYKDHSIYVLCIKAFVILSEILVVDTTAQREGEAPTAHKKVSIFFRRQNTYAG